MGDKDLILWIQPAVGSIFIMVAAILGMLGSNEARRGNLASAKVRNRISVIFAVVGIGLWVWLLAT